jgi:hypothetical protein
MMINRSIKNVIQMAVNGNRFAFSSHDEPVPTKLPKAQEILYLWVYSGSTSM